MTNNEAADASLYALKTQSTWNVIIFIFIYLFWILNFKLRTLIIIKYIR
jgi:hypothetical protein